MNKDQNTKDDISRENQNVVDNNQSAENKDSKLKTWLKRMGLGAFLFFFIKGLVWLAIFFGLFKIF